LVEHNIDLVILPSHSSHVTQPLDLNLNAALNRAFHYALININIKPVFPLEEKRAAGRPAKKEENSTGKSD